MEATILLDSVHAAHEVAWMLRAEWDGCNGIVQDSQLDRVALETAAGICDAQWCWSFESWLLPLIQREELLQRYHQGKRYFGKLNLVGVDLSYQDLTEVNLAGSNLSGADLTGARLCEAELWDANLANCKLVNTNLSGAHMNSINLAGADLSHANLSNAHLDGASLEGANLTQANLCNATLSSACLQGANLQDANLHSASLFDANLQSANLCGAVLVQASLFKANLNRAIISRADLKCGSIKKRGNFKGAVLIDAMMPTGQVYTVKSTRLRDVLFRMVFLWCVLLAGAWFWLWIKPVPNFEPSSQDENKEFQRALILERQMQDLKRHPLTP